MRRICCFCERWESGGIESFLTNILLYMDCSELEIDIVACCIRESVFTERLKVIGVRFVQLSGRLRSIQNYGMFRRLLREQRYDVVHFNLFQGLSLYYIEIAKQEGIPVRIAHSHGAGLRKSSTKHLKLAIHFAGRQIWRESATDFWACSGNAAKFLFSDTMWEEQRVRFIPNMIEIEKFRFSSEKREKMRNELHIRQDTTLIGTVGRLSSEKNHAFLLDVFQQVHQKQPDSVLILVGEGDCFQALQQKAYDLGVEGAVIFYGPSNRVDALLAAMDVFVFPSQTEGFGIAAVEAQAAGLPIVCSEGVPKEAQLTGAFYALPLSAGIDIWAETVLDCSKLKLLRETGADQVKQAGFDISDVVRSVEEKFLYPI